MGSRDHYVSQFHLRGFTDAKVPPSQEPWLWVGNCASGEVQRRAPKNVAWSRNLFSGPGGLADRGARIETYLAEEVEPPAAFALRGFIARPAGKRGAVPPEVSRYLAWAAARALPMRALYQKWVNDLASPEAVVAVEEYSLGSEAVSSVERTFHMVHSNFGERSGIAAEDVEGLRATGWRLVLENEDFLELVHIQAWYFQTRFFPQLRWIVLDAPRGTHFIVADRAVVWGFRGWIDPPPAALRDPDVQLIAPLNRSVALFAHHAAVPPPDNIAPSDVNCAVALSARDWVAGPTRQVVEASLAARIEALESGEPGE